MSEHHPFPENGEKSLQKTIERLKREKCVEITHGFPARDKHELLALLMHFFDEAQGRFPIIGVYELETDALRTFMLFNPDGQIEHRALWELIVSRFSDKALECAFTTGIKGVSSKKEKPCLVLEDVRIPDSDVFRDMFLPLQEGSDLATVNAAYGGNHPVNKDFTEEGRQMIKAIFAPMDITTHY